MADIYERLIDVMQKEGAKLNAPPMQIGIVGDDGNILIDSMSLEKEDYLIDCNLRLDDKEKHYIHVKKPSSGEYMTDSSHNGTLKEYKQNVLKKGDKVIVVKLENREQYVVLAKVVSA